VTPDDLTGPGPSWCTPPYRCRCAEQGRMRCWRPYRSPQCCGGRRLRARTPISGRPPPRLRQPSRSRHADRSGTARPLLGIPSGRGLDPLRGHLLAEEFILGSNTRITRMGGLPLIGITSRSGRFCRPSPSRWRIRLRDALSCRWQRVARVRRIPRHPVQRASFRPD